MGGAIRLLLAAAALALGCTTTQKVPLDCLTGEVVVYVDGRVLEQTPDALELSADEPHKIYFKRPGHEPQLIVLETRLGDDGTPELSPANVCVELVPVSREITVEVEEDPDAVP